MSKYYHTTVNRRPVQSNPDQAKFVARVVFEAEDLNTATSFALDALDAVGVPSAGANVLTEFGKIEQLDSLPFGLDADKPNWQNEHVKLWLIEPT